MRVADLIDWLSKADPKAEVLGEIDGFLYELPASDVRVGNVALVDIRLVHQAENGPHWAWYRDTHPYVTKGVREIKRRCEGVLIGMASDRQWPDLLSARRPK